MNRAGVQPTGVRHRLDRLGLDSGAAAVWVWAVCAAYLALSVLFATVKLDGDEFHVIKEPYEFIGGDYTAGYLEEGEYGKALETAWKAYVLYWRYRPLFAPVIAEEHKSWFEEEEQRFGYVKPESVARGDPDALDKYQERLIVPEPDRFYQHGAGKPLLPSLLTIPQLGLIALISSGDELLVIQHSHQRHPIFVLTRLVQIVAGLATILLVAFIAAREVGEHAAPLGAAIAAFVPISPMYFPDLHTDSIMTPFLILAAYLLFNRQVLWGGVMYGLALASKNTAVFLLPAFGIFYLIEGVKINGWSTPLLGYLWRRVRQLALFCGIAVVVLFPFANPLSYVIEVLTPITGRQFDPRGEDVSRWIIGRGTESGMGSSDARLTAAASFDDVFQLLVLLALFLAIQARLGRFGQLSLIMLLLVVPYGVVFSYSFNWRYLMFVPFLALFSVDALRRPHALAFAAVLALFTLAEAMDVIAMPGGADQG